jgi:hypothetical protein
VIEEPKRSQFVMTGRLIGDQTSCLAVVLRLRASSKVTMNNSSLNGLRRKATAPFAIACLRAPISSCAVMKMTGMPLPLVFNRSCISSPLIPGICTSRTTHSIRGPDIAFKSSMKSWPDVKVSASIPTERTSRLTARQTDSSSSTMMISGLVLLVTTPLPDSASIREMMSIAYTD